MTAFVGLISNDFAIIGTDTLVRYPKQHDDTQLRPRSYSCKTFLLPQFKSAFATTGVLQIGLCFFNFMVESAYGIDIDSLVNIDLKYFQQQLKLDYKNLNSDLKGTIYLFGYSNVSKRFKGFKLLVDLESTLEWQAFPSEGFMFKPVIDNWEDKIPHTERTNYCELIANLIKIQKKEDEQKDLANQVGVGGQILYTHLGVDAQTANLTIVTRIIYQFEDYIDTGNKMIESIDKRTLDDES